MAAATDAPSRHEELAALAAEVSACTRCRLADGRTTVVVGAGPADAELMLVGEAPGFHEDRQGVPFVGAAGELLDRLLASVGLAREDVYLATVLKCRPPGNRDPLADELEACEGHLFRQIALLRPRVIATFGTVATRLLSGRPHPITAVHGRPHPHVLGGHEVTLYPLYHPAAALYTSAMQRTLEEDFRRLPALLGGRDAPAAPPAAAPEPARPAAQLALF